MIDRAVRAGFLQPAAFEEAERGGAGLTFQALFVVAVAGVAAALGAGIGADDFLEGLAGGAITELVGWVLWALVTYVIGTWLFGAQTTIGETARTIGFAYGPGVFLILSFIPIIGGIISAVVTVWRLLAVYIALNVAFDINPLWTLVTAVLSVIPRVVLGWVIGVVVLDVGYL